MSAEGRVGDGGGSNGGEAAEDDRLRRRVHGRRYHQLLQAARGCPGEGEKLRVEKVA